MELEEEDHLKTLAIAGMVATEKAFGKIQVQRKLQTEQNLKETKQITVRLWSDGWDFEKGVVVLGGHDNLVSDDVGILTFTNRQPSCASFSIGFINTLQIMRNFLFYNSKNLIWTLFKILYNDIGLCILIDSTKTNMYYEMVAIPKQNKITY